MVGKRVFWAAFFSVSLCAAPALAGDAAPKVEPGSGQFTPPSKPSDKVKFCDAWYPPQETMLRKEGTALLSARIAANGDLMDIAITGSSGMADMDAASITCASHTFVRPATATGRITDPPIEIVWTFQARWSLSGHSFVTIPRPEGYPVTCNSYYPPTSLHAGEQGVSLVTFHIGTDGSVQQPALYHSSGSKDLDDAALGCVAKWRYFPATLDGKPVEFGWRANVNWSLH